jgi:hypothetical protein
LILVIAKIKNSQMAKFGKWLLHWLGCTYVERLKM